MSSFPGERNDPAGLPAWSLPPSAPIGRKTKENQNTRQDNRVGRIVGAKRLLSPPRRACHGRPDLTNAPELPERVVSMREQGELFLTDDGDC